MSIFGFMKNRDMIRDHLKPLDKYTDEQLIEHLDDNQQVDLREMAGICSEILRRMNKKSPLLASKKSTQNNSRPEEFEGKSISQLCDEAKEKYKTLGQTKKDFTLGQKVKIITNSQDFYFFDGETGVIDKIKSEDYLAIRVKFDEPFQYRAFTKYDHYFNPDDICDLDKALDMEKNFNDSTDKT